MSVTRDRLIEPEHLGVYRTNNGAQLLFMLISDQSGTEFLRVWLRGISSPPIQNTREGWCDYFICEDVVQVDDATRLLAKYHDALVEECENEM